MSPRAKGSDASLCPTRPAARHRRATAIVAVWVAVEEVLGLGLECVSLADSALPSELLSVWSVWRPVSIW